MFKSLFGAIQSDSDSDSDLGDNDNIDNDNLIGENELCGIDIQNNDSITHISKNGSHKVILKQEKKKGIAHQLWPAATLLCDYLEENILTLFPHLISENSNSSSSKSFNILELGSGIGLCGIFMSKLLSSIAPNCYCKIALTDVAEAQEILTTNILNNIESNQETRLICARELFWGNENHVKIVLMNEFYIKDQSSLQCIDQTETNPLKKWPHLLVIASDVVYWESLFQPLYDTILQIFHQVQNYGGTCSIIISHVKRWKKDTKFFQMIKKSGIMTIDVLKEQIDYVIEKFDGSKRRRIQRIYHIKYKTSDHITA